MKPYLGTVMGRAWMRRGGSWARRLLGLRSCGTLAGGWGRWQGWGEPGRRLFGGVRTVGRTVRFTTEPRNHGTDRACGNAGGPPRGFSMVPPFSGSVVQWFSDESCGRATGAGGHSGQTGCFTRLSGAVVPRWPETGGLNATMTGCGDGFSLARNGGLGIERIMNNRHRPAAPPTPRSGFLGASHAIRLSKPLTP